MLAGRITDELTLAWLTSKSFVNLAIFPPLKLCYYYYSMMAPRVLDLLFEADMRFVRVPRDDFMTGGALASLRRRVVTVGILEATGSFFIPHCYLRLLL